MVYDQNRPDEPQRPSGEDRPARRRIGRSWGPPTEEAPDPAEEARQTMGQAPEQYRFDPDRGRRHRYSEDPTGQMPNVEIAETGPSVPATRRPSPGDQFEPIPQAPQTPQAQHPEQQPSPFAPPGANQERSAPPGANQDRSVPPGANHAPPAANPNGSGPIQDRNTPPAANPNAPAPNHDRPVPPAAQSFAPPHQDQAAPEFGAPQQHPGYSAPPAPADFTPQQPNQAPQQDFGVPQQPTPDFGVPQQFSAPAPPSAPPQNFAPPATPANPQYSAPPEPSAPQTFAALPGAAQEYSAPAPPTPQDTPVPPQVDPHTGPIEMPPQQPPAVQHTPVHQLPIPANEQQTDQFPIVQQSVTEVAPEAVPSPPVTEQAALRTPPQHRPPVAEPTPPASVEKPAPLQPTPVDAPDPESARLVDAVRGVPGVRDAFHVTGPDGASSLRLELEEGVDPDEVHAVVSRVVAEQRAVEPGPQSADEPGRQIQGAQLHTPVETTAEVDLPDVGPVELRRVEIESAGLEAEVSVTLALGGGESTGKVAVPPIDWHIQHAAAQATVEALRPRLGANDVRVEVEHASIVATGPVKTAVVVILWLDGQAVRRLSGASVVTAERSRAVVSATLGALAAEVAH